MRTPTLYHRDIGRFLAHAYILIGDHEYTYTPCTYCGIPATDREHLTAVSIANALGEYHVLRPRGLVIVPSCRECNSLAGRQYFDSIQKKREFLKQRLRKRYKRYLAIPVWTEHELSQLSEQLQARVRRAILIQRMIKSRLRWR